MLKTGSIITLLSDQTLCGLSGMLIVQIPCQANFLWAPMFLPVCKWRPGSLRHFLSLSIKAILEKKQNKTNFYKKECNTVPVGLITGMVLNQAVVEQGRRCHSWAQAALTTLEHRISHMALSLEEDIILNCALSALIWEVHFRGWLRLGEHIFIQKSSKQI